ncbi:MAG: GNAT family N-acetyltransferase [Microbacterium ginsengisoli]|uniref:GNAT family N-acetyltransferase n=2 Tax=Microbacteriaceae TaxID=85023 RepID=UPI0006FB27DC|nr:MULTISPECIES: GNAT family N-acetyltransferase [unclassified Microbacterium]KQR91181.1 histone acetyltransferase [Microbacterium sp. Leaf347]MBN9197157.1 GNAT family N-acetyltransferase [Microbacterium ginsengisoli]OJU77104.1 MAG: N-acetyltransferase [Microbacterium sp. 71-23]
MDTPPVSFVPLTIPARIDDADATDFIDMVEVRNRIYLEISGNADEDQTPAELLPHYQDDPDRTRLVWLVRDEGAPIGRVTVDAFHTPGARSAYLLVELLREVWGRGIGTAGFDLAERTARELGRTVMQTFAEHPAASGEHLASPTGFGRIPRDHTARFLEGRGYVLGQVERKSVFDLHADASVVVAAAAAAAEFAVGYEVVQWEYPTPEEFTLDYAWMKSRMSTDTPVGDMEVDEEVWDADRVRRMEQRYLDSGERVLVTAARHVASGRLCAFNELASRTDPTLASSQMDTLVLSEHRGHRLGMLVKCAGLRRWRELVPDSPRLLTFNAEENRPMLSINETLGFTPAAYIGAWRRDLE